MNGEKPPVTKTMNFLMLHDDVIFNCLAHVSRLYKPTLSLVSKRFCSLLASKELYKTRTLLGCTKSYLYVVLSFPCEPNPTRLFTLCRRPTQTSNPNPNPNPKSSDNLMISVPTCNSYMSWWNIIAVGHNIYMIGGYLNVAQPSSTVFSMDCRSHTWHEAPSMQVAQYNPLVSVLDGKIYVVNRSHHNPSNSNWIECFDPKIQIWEHVPSPDVPDVEIHASSIFGSLAIEGKLYLFGKIYVFDNFIIPTVQAQNVAYKPKENKWDKVGLMEVWPLDCDLNSACVIDDVLYYYGAIKKIQWYDFEGKIQWYDFEGRSWRVLNGLEKLNSKLPNRNNRVKLVDFGRKIAVFWEKDVDEEEREREIWCAEISLERHNEQNINGKVEWCDVVLTVPHSCFVSKVLVVTV